MPIAPVAPYPKSPGDPVRSQDWNQAVDEVIRLDNDKVGRSGDNISGDLSVSGNLHTDQNFSVDDELNVGADARVGGSLTVGGTSHLEGRVRLFAEADTSDPFVSHAIGTEPSHNRYGGGSSYTDSIGHRFYRGGGELIAQIGFGGTGQPSNRLNSQFEGNVTVVGDLFVPKTAVGNARFTNATFDNESTLSANNLKLVMGAAFFAPVVYEFMVGHTFFSFGFPPNPSSTTFVRNLAVNQAGDVFVRGDLTVSGGKTGYVVDHFINRAGDTLEQGDVVVISRSQRLNRASGVGNGIPMPEVDLTDETGDSRVCGIVAKVVTENSLPLVEEEPQELSPEIRERIERMLETGEITQDDLATGRGLEAVIADIPVQGSPPSTHPLAQFAAKPSADLDTTRVEDRQLGQMVTLGCYAHCKVDADIAPIQAGDLLTTSPTKGHAQKVEDRTQAVGAIIGKALSPLRRGKGKIPVLVMMQ